MFSFLISNKKSSTAGDDVKEMCNSTADNIKAAEAISIALPWLPSARDLGCVGSTCTYLREAAMQDFLWTPIVEELEGSLGLDYGFDRNESKVKFQDISYHPTIVELENMLIPARSIGEERDSISFFPHPDDRIASQHSEPLVRPNFQWRCCDRYRIGPETGELEDLFHLASEAPVGIREQPNGESAIVPICREPVYVAREFPMLCGPCRTTLNNTSELIQHCIKYQHYRNVLPEMLRVRAEFIDPRHNDDYANWKPFKKAQELVDFRSSVVATLRAPVGLMGNRRMRQLVVTLKDIMTRSASDSEDGLFRYFSATPGQPGGSDGELRAVPLQSVLAKCTLERIKEICVEDIVVPQFLHSGVTKSVLLVLSMGWRAFEMPDVVLILHYFFNGTEF